MLRRLFALFSVAALEPEVMLSQIEAFSKQVPLLYIIGNINSFILAYTHFYSAPLYLTLIVPVPMLLICVVRLSIWRRSGSRAFSAKQARARLRSTIWFTSILGAIYAGWALCLFPYGDDYARGHVVFFMAITVIGTIFCLMHLRPAALSLTIVVTVPFMIKFTSTGQPILTAMALNFLFVVLIMVFILSRYYEDFTQLVFSQKGLAALNNENFRLANLDSLTGLPNRRSFFRDFAAMLAAAGTEAPRVALGLLDLDGFKPVNDVFGHAAGDKVLQEIGLRLREIFGPETLLARLGGDEFGIAFNLSAVRETLMARGEAICAAVQLPIELPNGVAWVAVTIGFVATSPSISTYEQMVERADYALYTAKTHCKGGVVVFSDQHEHAIRAKGLLEQELRGANFEAEMSLQFQPIVEVGSGAILAYEALARWNSPMLGAVSPMVFIAASERTGLINRITEILFAKALTALRSWPEAVDLSFNLSVQNLASTALIERLRDMVLASGIAADRIAFEITETSLMRDFDQARDMLLVFKAMGAKIALDDFGTGYSSLHYVHKLPLDRIKIDRSFIAEVVKDQVSRDIVKSIVDLCRNLKMTCVVEGVETAEQMLILRTLGCAAMQGYYFGRPEASVGTPAISRSVPTESRGLSASTERLAS